MCLSFAGFWFVDKLLIAEIHAIRYKVPLCSLLNRLFQATVFRQKKNVFFRFLNPGKCNKTRVHAENLSNSSNKKTRNDQKYNKYAVSAGGQNNRYLREFDLTREEECNLNNAFFFAAESVILR